MKKTKTNPSGYPVLSKTRNTKSEFIKRLENYRKKLNIFDRKKR